MARAPASPLDTFLQLRDTFFERYLRTQPEEATTLGLHHLDDRLKDLSPAALADEDALHRDVLAQLERLPEEELPLDAWLDRRAMLDVTRFHVHERARGPGCNLELSTYPHAMLQYQIGQAETAGDWEAIASRAARIPTFLRQHEHRLTEGLAAGRAPDLHILQDFLEGQFPALLAYYAHLPALPQAHRLELSPAQARALQLAAHEARDGFASHVRFFQEHLLPRARPGAVLGEEEYLWRLRHVFDLHDAPEALMQRAREVLVEAQWALLHAARTLAPEVPGAPSSFAHLGDVRALLARLEAHHPARDEDVIPLYRGLLERAEHFIHEQGLFHLPEGGRLGLKALPPGMVDVRGTNWPAPLLDARKAGWFVLDATAAEHPTVWAATLAVHEGIPGHFLQSAAWQRGFSHHPAPVRFLLVTDHVAMARGHFGPMLNIEGYATYAEERMRRAGFYTPPEALATLVARALRAVRVEVDIGLHTGRMDDEAAVRHLVLHAFMPEPNARREVLRYKRIPMQAITYLLGALEFERLAEDCRREHGADFHEADFHEALFAFGPIPPSRLRLILLEGA